MNAHLELLDAQVTGVQTSGGASASRCCVAAKGPVSLTTHGKGLKRLILGQSLLTSKGVRRRARMLPAPTRAAPLLANDAIVSHDF